ncbi:MAG TPA: protease pro-enzyme activation domain-containing protein [Bryobacteraceae bacterium]|nr:protease pro-enzyme activation domain-containing protein [Bryobacteraceae bacterium]
MRQKCLNPFILIVLATIWCAASAMAQTSRITQNVDNRVRTVLTGHLHPKAVAAALAGNDQGRVSPSLALSYITVTLAPSASQQADLEKFLTEQQTPGAPNYHHWLTPEEFGQRFGASDADIGKISQWLEQQGLHVVSVARGRSWIAASGTAAQVETAFQTEIHSYLVDGETHYANATEPSVPAAFGSVVKSIRGLNDFRMKPRLRPASRKPTSAKKPNSAKPDYNSAYCDANCLAPDDFATIYDVAPLYAAGIDGSGQKIAIAGQIEVDLSDIEQFRSMFNLPANDPQPVLVPGSPNPGDNPKSGDLAESDLDLEWSGAVARNATIIFVYSTDVMSSVQYAIDQNLAPVLSVSYGSCELETPASEYNEFSDWAKQANAQGITWFAASGDNGGADCDDTQNPGLAVDLPGSVPEVTSVGGTEFVEGSGTYWSLTNGANGGSALSYIPETTWNDSVEDQEPAASGGGASILFSKPSWQTGPGVPADSARDVPDVALNASDDHDPYVVYSSGSLQAFGGTSVPTPSFAGITVLLNQHLASGGVGNINPKLYSLAQSNPSIFHDVTTGNNIVTVSCGRRDRNCGASPVGYYAGAGFDEATGLGSVDAYKLVMGWNGGSTTTPPPTNPDAKVTLLANLSTVASNDVVYLTATVTSTNATTPAGSISFSIGDISLGSAALTGSAGTATATLAVNGLQLPLGSGTITATYNGTSSASLTVSVTGSGTGSAATPAISAVTNGASFQQGFAPGAILSVFGAQLSPATQSAASVPLPLSTQGVAVLVNGVAAPLYYVSSGQLNVQIPYEITAGNSAIVSVNNNGHVTTQTFQVAAAAPGIFTTSAGALVPTSSAAAGQEIAFYITGAGAVTPAIATGAAPPWSTPIADLPMPVEKTTVTIGGLPATIDFIGIPWALVGVTQINVQVPAGLPAGPQAVVVTVGETVSAPATLTITN